MKHAQFIHWICLNNQGNRKTFIKAPSHSANAALLIGKQGHLLRLSGSVLLKRKDLFYTQVGQLSKPLSFSNAVYD